MGNVGSLLREGNDAAFDRKRLLLTLSNEERAYYTSLRDFLSNRQLEPPREDQKNTILETLDAFRREADVVYEPIGDLDFPGSSSNNIDSLLECFPLDQPQPVAAVSVTATAKYASEEAALRQICQSHLSTTHELFTALQRLQQKCQPDETAFLKVLASYPHVARLFAAHSAANMGDVATAGRVFQISGNRHESARVVGKLAFADNCITSRTKKLERSRLLDENTLANLSHDHSHHASFHAAMMNEATRLGQLQQELEQAIPLVTLMGCSLIETIEKLLIVAPLCAGALPSVMTIALEFEVDAAQLWNCLVRILVGTQQSELLLELVAFQRPPSGCFGVVKALIDAEEMDLAKRVIVLIQDPDEKYDATKAYISVMNEQEEQQ